MQILYTIIKKVTKRILTHTKIQEKKYKLDYYLNKVCKREGTYQYTVISTVYNVEKYLEMFFESMTGQTLYFEKHIHLVMVDDGSSDSSAEIIGKWQKKFPNNITYVKKENGGQASARNLGMQYAKTEWITYIDSDDFVDHRYFEEVDTFLRQHENEDIGLVSCNFIYYENNAIFQDTHPLNYRFKDVESIVSSTKMQQFIQLAVTSVFFKKSLLVSKAIEFRKDIRPNFEDGHFVNRYIIENEHIHIAFLKKAKYFYRKRSDRTSTLDTSWKSVGKFLDVPQNGYLDLINIAKQEYNKVPHYIQRTVLYNLISHFKLLLNNAYRLNHLSDTQKKRYEHFLQEIFNNIDIETISTFELAGCQYYHKLGFLNLYKQTQSLPYQIIYIDAYAQSKMKIHYYHTNKTATIDFHSNETTILTQKKRKYDFLGKTFVYETIAWINIGSKKESLQFSVDKQKTYLELEGYRYEDLPMSEIEKHFNMPFIGKVLNHIDTHLLTLQTPSKRGFKDTWLFIDRNIQADDNAEHLYRYIADNHPEINIYFILNKTSHDWVRLKNDRFNLIPLGSFAHLFAVIQAKYLISSHVDYYVTDFIPRHYFKPFLKYKFIYLQHGVIKDDLSTRFNTKEIDCFTTSSQREYNSIAGDDNHYKFTPKEVVLTGFARHDALLRNNISKDHKTILIMPTWRESLVGHLVDGGSKRTLNSNFAKTEYFKNWSSLLQSKALKKIVYQYGYNVIFFPHFNIQPYLPLFNIPKYITILSHQGISIQELFQQSDIMITDYSSVAFEMAILQKEVIYYQFDHEQVFGGGHIYQAGYFNYEKDSFGPICYQQKEVLNTLEAFLKSHGKVPQEYMDRMQNFFAFHDMNNCQRIYTAIQNLENTK